MGYLRMRRQSGVTLIELLVAMVLGLLVAGGIVTVFTSTSSSNKAQLQLANLQEEGRFAITRLTGDLRMANGEYCSSTGGVATNSGSNNLYLDSLRAPKVYTADYLGALSDVTTPWGSGSYPKAPTEPYYAPAFLSMRGYDCTKTACKPVDPHGSIAAIPKQGAAVGNRVLGTDLITLRYMDPARGWVVDGTGTYTTPDSSGGKPSKLKSVTVNPKAGEPSLSTFKAGDLAMLADCSNAQIFAADGPGAGVDAGEVVVNAGKNFANSFPLDLQPLSAAKLFDVNTDLLTVTYYLEVVDAGQGHTTGALMRRVNGVAEEIVRGVERLDFLYGVEDINGSTRYFSAGDVDDRAGGTFNCPPSVPKIDTSAPQINPAGCMWRAVKSIEVRILMDGQTPLYSLAPNDLHYTYASDGNTKPVAPDDSSRAVTPVQQGFANEMLRREFSALVSVRNYNP